MLWLQAYCSSYRLLEALFGVDPDHCRMPIWHWHRARHIAVLLKQVSRTSEDRCCLLWMYLAGVALHSIRCVCSSTA